MGRDGNIGAGQCGYSSESGRTWAMLRAECALRCTSAVVEEVARLDFDEALLVRRLPVRVGRRTPNRRRRRPPRPVVVVLVVVVAVHGGRPQMPTPAVELLAAVAAAGGVGGGVVGGGGGGAGRGAAGVSAAVVAVGVGGGDSQRVVRRGLAGHRCRTKRGGKRRPCKRRTGGLRGVGGGGGLTEAEGDGKGEEGGEGGAETGQEATGLRVGRLRLRGRNGVEGVGVELRGQEGGVGAVKGRRWRAARVEISGVGEDHRRVGDGLDLRWSPATVGLIAAILLPDHRSQSWLDCDDAMTGAGARRVRRAEGRSLRTATRTEVRTAAHSSHRSSVWVGWRR